MSKGAETRVAIIERAMAMASQVGLEGLSLGTLATDVGMSKSGLFAHFKSKQELQIQILDTAVERFNREVVGPAFRQPRGEPRIRAILESWMDWSRSRSLPGGCLFLSLSAELDDRPGPLRDRLQEFQRIWISGLETAVRMAVDEGHFRADLDTEQFAYDLFQIILGCHHFRQLMRDPQAEDRARRALDRLIAASI
jgi:AcrR family transcriptional regulator